MESRAKQLGMNPGTASHRLVKDLLYDFVIKAGHKCHRCGKEMDRENFSIEHIEPWLHSPDPVALFFDISNIAYSHLRCNAAAGRRPNQIHADAKERSRVQFARYYAKNGERWNEVRNKRRRKTHVEPDGTADCS